MSDNPCSSEYDLCNVSLDPSVNLLDGAAPSSVASNNPTEVVSGVYEFDGSKSATAYLLMSDAVRDSAMSITDHFSVSMWMKIDGNNLVYPLSFERGTTRYFSWLLRYERLNFFYQRDRLDNLPDTQVDLGEDSRVGLSFYYDTNIFTEGTIRDGKWHFLKMDINYPSIVLYIDGYAHYANEGHYFNIENNKVGIDRDLNAAYDMPARILKKSDSLISQIVGRLGGSSRGSHDYVVDGLIRLPYFTDLMDNSQYICLASCNDNLLPQDYTPGSNFEAINATTNGFSVFYQPVSRSLYFSKEGGTPSNYTEFVQSLVYHTNGYLPAQVQENTGEGRQLELQVIDFKFCPGMLIIILYFLYR